MSVHPQTQSHPLLYDEPPLIVLPSLATAIGLNEAIIVQQVHYWTVGKRGSERDGRRWTYNTVEQWREQFPFWSLRTVVRTFARLRERGILIATQAYNQQHFDRTLWYAIDYAALAALTAHAADTASVPFSQNGTMHPVNLAGSEHAKMAKSDHAKMAKSDLAKMAQPIPETIPETTTETNAENSHSRARAREAGHRALQEAAFAAWYASYPRHINRKAALAVWLKLDPDEELTETMMGAVERQKEGRKWREGYINAPDVWLRGEKWTDEPEPLRAPTAPPPRRNAVQEGLDSLARVAAKYFPNEGAANGNQQDDRIFDGSARTVAVRRDDPRATARDADGPPRYRLAAQSH